ncbi:hypothetical protein LshimejAT787_1002010 [Lyophyllum shimeji]|uniref:Uncharacterized protein n=1 Tax=Lyophyllum shimeji TaxID=47721 RepID=A0A9P3PTV8_LYOSH|nr:hypothetical protein LshimejAT787_1002010 [Lyophyllum shimeji]
MSSAQTLNYDPAAVPAYAFLSKPPPPQKKRPAVPPPPTPTLPRNRSSTFTAIASWAAHVQPGSPGSPHSSRRRSSLSRRPSTSSRRPSFSRTPSPRTPSRSFLVLETPSPETKDFAINLTDLGYTSVFVRLPHTPGTPSPFLMKSSSGKAINPDTFPAPAVSPRAPPLKRFRSLSILRSRNRSAATLPPSPTKSIRTSKPRSPTKADSPQILAASVAKRKKAVYAYAKSSSSTKAAKPQKVKPQLPPSLAAELALMQFADGGSTEANIKRLMEAQARAAAPAGSKSSEAVVGDVYRDGKGGVWWDREEEMEYMHLLGGHSSSGLHGPGKWVSFGGEVKEGKDAEDEEAENGALALASLAGLGRRDSATSTASAASSLDPCNVVKPADEDGTLVRIPFAPLPSVPFAAPAPAPAPTPAHAPATEKENQTQPKRRPTPEPILTIPSRPRTAHHHLRASPNFFLLDLNAFSVPSSPSPRTPRTPRTPASPYPCSKPKQHVHTHTHTRTRSSPTRPAFSVSASQGKRLRGPARRRPAPPPLTIVAHVPMRGVTPEVDGDVEMAVAVADAKRDFLEASFKPAVPSARPAPAPAPAPLPAGTHGRDGAGERTLHKKASRPILALFGRK